jgi:hypothetical protein
VRRLISRLRLGREEGQVLPIFAAGAVAMLLMTGVVVDGGNLFQNKQSLQNAADSAAIAAALEVAKGGCTTSAPAQCGKVAGQYAGLNNANGGKGHSSTQTALPKCSSLSQSPPVSTSQPPTKSPGCYVYPYKDDAHVEVWLTQQTSTLFGGLIGIGSSAESARAVGVVVPGNVPPIAFAALEYQADCKDNHTLLIKSSGNLTVNSGIYVNSCHPHDGFDIFAANPKTGPYGSITAPTIETTGGWEVDAGTGVFVGPFPNPPECVLTKGQTGGTKIQVFPPDASSGCPVTGQNQTQCSGVGVAVCDPFSTIPPVPALVPRNVAPITGVRRVTNVATVYVAGPIGHGLTVGSSGESVVIKNVGAPFDGAHTVTSVPDSTTFTFTVANGPTIPLITQKQLSTAGGTPTATLTTSVPVTFFPNNLVTVSGISSIFNTSGPVGVTTGTSSFSYNPTPYAMTVTNELLQSGTATLTVNNTNSTAPLCAGCGYTVNVSAGVGAPFAGSQTVATVPSATTFTFPLPGLTTTLNITNMSISGTVATLTTPTNNVFPANDQIVVNSGDSRFDGTYKTPKLTTGGGTNGGTTLQYTIPAVTATVSQEGAGPEATPSVINQRVALTLATFPGFEVGDTVTLSGGLGLAYGSGTVTLTALTAASKSIRYPTPTVASMGGSTRSGTTVTVTTASAHGLKVGNTVNISGYDSGHTCFNVGNTTVTSVPSNTKFTFAVPATCTPANNGTNGVFQLVSAASFAAPANQTVTLATTPILTPAVPGNWTVTVPLYIKRAVSPAGTATVTGVPLASVAATAAFTPFWMSTPSGESDFAGSPTIPFPDEIPSGTATLNPGTYWGGICIGAPSGSNCSGNNCKAAGGSTTTIQSYSPNPVQLKADVPDNFDSNVPPGTGTILVDSSGSEISKDDLIAIDDEEMTVTGPPVDNGNNTFTIPVSREANGTEDAAHTKGTEVRVVVTTLNGTAYSPAVSVKLPAGQTTLSAIATSIPVNSSAPVGVGDIIQIDNEAMTVTAIPDNSHLTVKRGTFKTTPTTHNNGRAVLKIFDASAPPPATVTLTEGVYIMAGGGFSVCGAGSVSAPDGVMIYNTNDPTVPTGNGALGQVNINTAGSVHLGPMTSGIYAGMTIFEDRSKAVSTGCPQGDTTKWDVALQSAAALPSSGELGSISGTIYAAGPHATVGDTMSGTANLAVISSCIYIDGATSTFLHDTSSDGLAGEATATLDG